jgi:hypothetical protein
LEKSCDAALLLRIIRGCGDQHADAPHPVAKLRSRHQRPRDGCASGQGNELAPLHIRPKSKQRLYGLKLS